MGSSLASKWHFRFSTFGLLLSCVSVTTTLACDADNGTNVCFHALRAAIYGGTATSGHAIARERQLAVVGVEVSALGRYGLCSGVLIAPGVALTAKHCALAWSPEIPETEPREIELVVGDSTTAPLQRVRVQDVIPHDSLDLAALLFDPAELSALGIGFIPLVDTPLDGAWIGTPAELSGFGLTDDALGTSGVRLFATEPIIAVDDTYVVVERSGLSGACIGDSGGPLLARSDTGLISVIGILDDGDPSCRGADYFTRGDVIANWISTQAVKLMTGLDTISGCDGLDSIGICLRGNAIWCAEGTRSVTDCDTSASIGTICGWSTHANGFRCVLPQEDTCQGLGSLRRCEDDQVVACEAGVIARESCSECHAVCSDLISALGAGCITE